MKKQLKKLATIVLLTISILAITQIEVYAQEKTGVSLLKTSEETYLIYIEEALDTEFIFSFSESTEILEEDLIFSASGIDSSESNVAYMTKEIAENFKDGKAYIWIKINEELKSYAIDLNKAITIEEIAFVNSTTSRIQVETDGSEKTSEKVEGVEITHTQGKVTITEEDEAFSYYSVKVEDTETTNFMELVNQIKASENLTNYERITLIREFSNTYNKILEGIENWTEVPEDKVILQPQESKEDDIYLVWLKNDTTGEHDVQILICDDDKDIKVEAAKKVIVYETTKLPVTYDSIITLIIALVIIVATIIALVVLKKKLNKKD